MKKTRLTIACREWQAVTTEIGPAAAGVLLYLLAMMRDMQTAEIAIRIEELADALGIPPEAAEETLTRIESAGYLTRLDADPSGVITLRSDEEEKKQAEARRKRAARLLSRFQGQSTGQSGDTFFDHGGQSADSPKEVHSEVMMIYDPNPTQEKSHALFDHTGNATEKEKESATKKIEKSLTERPCAHADAPASASAGLRQSTSPRVDQIELATDQLEADYIDIVGRMPNSLRNTLRKESDDVRESFYLYCRKKRGELGTRWTADSMRAAYLAARRIPAERRADSILAAYMGDWKTIRDCGSGVYFEKQTGRVVSLVRGPVEAPKKAEAPAAALGFLRNMRRS